MFDALRKYTQAIGGLTEVPRQRAEQLASSLAKQGLISRDQVRSIAQEVVRRSQENRDRLREAVKRELPKLGVASRTEVDRLKQRVQALEANQRASAKRAAATTTRSTTATTRPAAKKAAARKAPAAKKRAAR